MTVLPSRKFSDSRMGELYGQLIERHAVGSPITTKQAMEFVRAAYAQGYIDRLRGIRPKDAA